MFLTEADAKSTFQIGHTPFREACNRLLYEGLLESIPRRGYFIPQMSLRKVRNLFQTRILIESQAIELAAVRATPLQIQQMVVYESPIPIWRNSAGGSSSLELSSLAISPKGPPISGSFMAAC
jgi:Bacterial regulatory proteins, gntR family